jgi:hypothetical protein
MNDLLASLQKARSMEERDWLITQDLLATLPPDLAQAALVAALPRYFDGAVLGAVLELDDVEQVYTDLRALPFVERHGPEAHRVHKLTRAGMLTYYWRTPAHSAEALALHRRLWHHFAEREESLEALYHHLFVEPDIASAESERRLRRAHGTEAEALLAVMAEQDRELPEQQRRGLAHYLIRPEIVSQQEEETYCISGKTYRSHPLPGWADDLLALRSGGASYFVLPVQMDGWAVPEARVGDYVLVRKEWVMTKKEGHGVVWEGGSGWSVGDFRRKPDGKITFHRHPPTIIGSDAPVSETVCRIIALLKPSDQ